MNPLYIGLIFGSVVLALVWAAINAISISRIKIEAESENASLMNADKLDMMVNIGTMIAKGANSFLKQEYCIMSVFIVLFGIIIALVVDIFGQGVAKFRLYATVAFIIGSLTSMLCGYIGMTIAVASGDILSWCALPSGFLPQASPPFGIGTPFL